MLGGEGGDEAGMLGKCKNVPVSEKAREKQEGGQGGVTAASFSGQAAVSSGLSYLSPGGGQLQI